MDLDLSHFLTERWSLLLPEQIVRAAYVQFRRVIVTTHMEAESGTMLHLAASVVPDIPIVCLKDPTFNPEYAEHLRKELRLNLHVYEYTGDKLKALVFHCKQFGAEAMIHGIRRDQTSNRLHKRMVERGKLDGLYRVHPILDWTQADTQLYSERHKLPKHPTLMPKADRTECGIHCFLRT